jgi:predicted small lipoprotein YifL
MEAIVKLYTAALLMLALTACGRAAPPPSNTPDVCAGATDPGARQKFTFDQIVPCLKSVAKVSAIMANNMKRDDAWDTRKCGEICYSPARLVYQNGVDSCMVSSLLSATF